MIRLLARNCAQVFAAVLLSTGTLAAATLDVVVEDRKGKPVPDVVVLVESSTGTPLSSGAAQQNTFKMDQRNMMFDPYILVVPVGSAVTFLNSDATAHHVYSFSKTKRFTLPLYKGTAPDPVVFDKTGVVTLGCNIHDHMVGYILVAESPLHARTDADGRATIEIEGDGTGMQLRIWSPRIRDKRKHLVQSASTSEPVQFKLKKKLKAPHNPHDTGSSEWEDYSQ
ncbi:MAG: methylamine utilization protein [Pseudomonadota bacterium]